MPEKALPPTTTADLPRESVEFALQDKIIKAWMRSVPPEVAEEFLRNLFDEVEIRPPNVVPIRGRAAAAAKEQRERSVLAWTRAKMPGWLSRMHRPRLR